MATLAETLYRGLADNGVGRLIEGLLRADPVIVDGLGFAPLDDTGAQLLFRLVAAAYERRSLGVASHWPFESWARFLPEHTTAMALLDRLLHHSVTVVTSGDSYRMKQALREEVGHQRRCELSEESFRQVGRDCEASVFRPRKVPGWRL